MTTRLAITVAEREEDFLAAATRIREVTLVDVAEDPDAIVADDSSANFNGKPMLLVNAEPMCEEPWLFPALPSRFAPDVLAIRDGLDAGNLGAPGLMRMHLWTPRSGSPSDMAKVGAVDLALWLFEQEPDSIYGITRAEGSTSCSLIHLGFPAGGMAVLDFTDSLPDGEDYRSLSLIGSRGAAYADDHRNRNLFFDGDSPKASCPDFEHTLIQPMLQDFITNIRMGTDSNSATQSYRKASEIVTKAAHNIIA